MTEEKKAESEKGRIESFLTAIEQGYVTVPADADFWQFVFRGGKLEAMRDAPLRQPVGQGNGSRVRVEKERTSSAGLPGRSLRRTQTTRLSLWTSMPAQRG